MKLTVEGSDRSELPPDEVAAALRDPALLARALPGEVERTGARVATVSATVGLAGTRGTYRARVHVVEATDRRFEVRIAAAGEPGTIEAELTVELHADGTGTRVDHQLVATLDGRLAGLGRHVLEGTVAAGASRFLSDLEAAVRAPVAATSGVSSGASSGVSSASGDASSDGAGRGVDGAGPPVASAAHGTASPVRTALLAAAAGALVMAVVLRWWDRRQGA